MEFMRPGARAVKVARRQDGRKSHAGNVASLVVVRLLILWVLLFMFVAGCNRPLARGAEPDRPSIDVGLREIGGEYFTTNGTALVSAVPTLAAPAWSADQPMNCLLVQSADGNQSYLAGAIVDVVWTPASSATQELEVEVRDDRGRAWIESGPSPLHVVVAMDEQDESDIMLSPVTVLVRPPGSPLLFPDQDVDVGVTLGALESRLTTLGISQCGTVGVPSLPIKS